MKNIEAVCKTAAILIALVALIVFGAGAGWGKTVRLNAIKITKAPKIDGKSDKAWSKIKRTKINIPGEFSVNVKAAYTGGKLYFLFQWPDPDMSMNRVYLFKGGKWKKKRGNEDRFNVLWDIAGSIKKFGEKGCKVLCHKNDEDDAFMYTNSPAERGDLWHWKSQRTNPVGYADDQYVIDKVDTSRDEATGRRADKESGGSYSANWDKQKKRPLYTFAKGKGGPVLLKKKSKKVTGSTEFRSGMMVPREVLERPKGSRGDVSAKGVWKKKKWTLEISRALKNGHDDDVQFDDMSRSYLFGISIHNNAGGERHVTSPVIELRFVKGKK